ncbi:fibronectin type III domain-containing protein [Haloferula sp. BvORR071]|uniref:fibronectin type III domain-containing protein n=1 Tax=Haloferula sp. BvORR071 TaxID=1396141 RepID=UPI000697FD9A|nr:fibronectin type III domain-containing protein [Haloferula sp. BvORR071]
MRLETQRPINNRRGLALVLAVLSSLILPAALQAAEAPAVSLAWNANPESSVTGYKVYFGTQSGVYDNVADVGKVTQTSLPALTMGSTYFMAVSAYNSSGQESPKSAEFKVTATTPVPPIDTTFAITPGSGSASQGKLQWKYLKSEQASLDRFAVYSSEDLVTWTESARLASTAATNSDSQYLYFDYAPSITKQKMFFKVAPRNAFGETN